MAGGYYPPDAIHIPSWQAALSVITAANEGSTAYRNSPDVSANANFTYYVCADQTTCTANEYGGKSLGFINPLMYPMGLSSGYGMAFHDIRSGSNGYPAVTGYDLATGWGA